MRDASSDDDVPTPRPGPDALYGENPTLPQLENGPDWNADPLMVCGTEAYVDGEYLYQDYVYDDHGADTRSVLEPPPDGHHLGGFYSRPTGDFRYPDDPERFGYNGADLLEFRVRPTDEGVAYRITLNTMVEPDAAAVAIGIDTSGEGGPDDARTDWGYGLGDLGAPVGHRLVTWGTGAELDGDRLDDERVSVDVERNQIELEVPLDPGEDTWRHYLVVGLWNPDEQQFLQVAADADAKRPGGAKRGGDVPPVFNVGFRFDEPMGRNVDLDSLLPRLATVVANAPREAFEGLDGPQGLLQRLGEAGTLLPDLKDPLGLLDATDPPLDPLDSLDPLGSSGLSSVLEEVGQLLGVGDVEGVPRALGRGNWCEDAQARALAERDISRFHADVDFERLEAGVTQRALPESGFLPCLYPSRHEMGAGVDPFANVLRGRIQPYGVYVPDGVDLDSDEPVPMVTMLHSLGNCYTQYPVWMPGYVEAVGEACGAVVLLPQSRGPGLWYNREAELDVFEAWRDLETRFKVDRSRVSVTGYSMGGFGAIITATKHPDCFGRCFAVVGPPAADPLEAPTNDLLATPSLLMDGLFGGEDGGSLFTIFDGTPENALRLTENLRHVPTLLWHGGADALVPLLGPTNYANRLRSHGYRHRIDVFPSVDHFLLALGDSWGHGPASLAETEVPDAPSRVTFRRVPEFDYPDLGLVHDGAHWVTAVEPRDEADDAFVDAISLAEGYGEPISERFTDAGTRPMAYTGTGLEWGPPVEEDTRGPANAFELELEGVAEVTLWVESAGLDPTEELTLQVDSDGESTVRLRGSFGTHEVAVSAGATTHGVEPLA